jgi:peptidoglycan hydrolase-like protein with peptidoglycan-binding domain
MLQSLLFHANAALERAASNSPPLKRGASGDAVRCLQLALASLGYGLPLSVKTNPLAADGMFGAETEQAVRKFQQQQALAVDGIAGRQTLTQLDQMLSASGQDPLQAALRDLRRLGAGLVATAEAGAAPHVRKAFEARLREADGLVLGDAPRLALLLRQTLPYV